jgi:hypothetical protein
VAGGFPPIGTDPAFFLSLLISQVDQDRENLILQAELLEKLKKSIVIVPSVYVNNVVQRGTPSPTCSNPCPSSFPFMLPYIRAVSS